MYKLRIVLKLPTDRQRAPNPRRKNDVQLDSTCVTLTLFLAHTLWYLLVFIRYLKKC